jgi:hypothetical protein
MQMVEACEIGIQGRSQESEWSTTESYRTLEQRRKEKGATTTKKELVRY